MPADRSYVTGNFVLELDGRICGFMKSIDGGSVYADVIEEALGPGGMTRKHIGHPKYEEFSVRIGFGMAPAVYEWISAAWTGQSLRRSGAIVECDQNLNARTRREFDDAMVTSITIPPCDADSKEAGFLSVKFAPESTRWRKGDGKVLAEFSKDQRSWVPSNFRLQIDGLDCSRVKRIEAFTVTQAVAVEELSEKRARLKAPGRLQFPHFSLALPQGSADTWLDWHEDFVINGNNDSANEKGGTLELLAPNLEDVLVRVAFDQLGIFRLGFESDERSHIEQIRAELYCEAMALSWK